MTHLSKAILLTAGLALAACTSPGQFDNDNTIDLNTPTGPVDPAGDPTSSAYFSTAVGDRVFFVSDEHTLGPEARQTLTGQAAWLLANAEYSIIVEGHADEQNTKAYNLALSNRRANSVKEFLVSQGVSAARIQTIGYGKERPVEVCSDETCWSQNRRGVTVLRAAIS
ncbi:MAG: OmpA family protein [Rhodobacteraceae bacterium]|nr:OmpA family protein [Paracoccaceae bacterium]